MRMALRWRRSSPGSSINFDLVLEDPKDLDVARIIELLASITEQKHRGLTLSNRAVMEFQRWSGEPATPLGSEAFVLLSNWFLTNSGDRHSRVATQCESLWDALFLCRPERRLSSPAPGQNHAMLPAEFEAFWRRLMAAQGDHDQSGPETPTLTKDLSPVRVGPPLESRDGGTPEQLRARIHKGGLDCVVEGPPRAVADLLKRLSSWDT